MPVAVDAVKEMATAAMKAKFGEEPTEERVCVDSIGTEDFDDVVVKLAGVYELLGIR